MPRRSLRINWELISEVVLYIKTPPDRKALQSIIDGLEDPVEDSSQEKTPSSKN